VVVVPVLSFVSASITREHRDGDDGTMAVATVWERREDLDAMRASGEEPLARRILREAGGAPDAAFFEIVGEARSDAA
jgi:hypothetical protein